MSMDHRFGDEPTALSLVTKKFWGHRLSAVGFQLFLGPSSSNLIKRTLVWDVSGETAVDIFGGNF